MKASLAFLFLLASLPAFAAEQALIDTGFTEGQNAGKVLVGDRPADLAALPMKLPSSLRAGPSTHATPGVVELAQEDLDTLKAPYALVKSGKSVGDDGIEHASDAGLEWNLSKLNITEGHFVLTCEIAALQNKLSGGGLRVVLRSGSQELDSKLLGPAGNQLFYIRFFQSGLFAGGKTVPVAHLAYQAGEPLRIRMDIDFGKKEWSIFVDDAEWLSHNPFPEWLKAAAPGEYFVEKVEFASTAGRGDDADGAYAIGNLKLVRLP